MASLQLGGFEPYHLDKHDIAAGEDWEVRLDRLIEAADTVVFVISPTQLPLTPEWKAANRYCAKRFEKPGLRT